METYVITGGAGFIGSHLVERLLNDGHRVRVVDNFSTGQSQNLQPFLDNPMLGERLEIFECDVVNLDDLRAPFEGADYVYHQAALPSVPRSVEDPISTHHHCVTGTLNVLVAARDSGVKRVVYAASSSAYGDVDVDYKVETLPPAPKSPYGAAKLFGEYYCSVFTEVYGLETVSLRYFNVFGARQNPKSQYAAVIPLFITRLAAGKAPIIYGDGLQSRDFTYIDNVVHGNMLAAKAPQAAGKVMNLATGGRITLLDLVGKLNIIMGTDLAPIHEDERAGDIKHSRADIDRAGELLGYEPVVEFEEGLRRTVAWYTKVATS